MKITTHKLFETEDFALATALLSEGFTLNCIDRGSKNKSIFVFYKVRMLEKIVKDFYSNNLLVNPNIYETNRRNLKSQLSIIIW